MLPIPPTAHAPPRENADEPAAPPSHSEYMVAYMGCGAAAGMVAGLFIAGFTILIVANYEDYARGQEIWPVVRMPFEHAIGLLIKRAMEGALAGIFGGQLLWLLTCWWPALRHPIRAASCSAALIGMVRLLAIAFIETLHANNPFRIEREYWERTGLDLGALLIAGAVFGLCIAFLITGMENRFNPPKRGGLGAEISNGPHGESQNAADASR